jgi:hypothetical protein
MLFLTVYGPELESLFYYIHNFTCINKEVSREQIYASYVPHAKLASKGHLKNVEDGIQYLKAAKLIVGDTIYSSAVLPHDLSVPFAVILLRQFQQLKAHPHKLSSLDLLYITLLEQLYIIPNRMWISNLHSAANQLDLAQQAGGISQEKIGAWKRVMEFLGVGYRMGGGFYCLFQPDLLSAILQQWPQKDGSLQEFFESYLQDWLPCLSARGDVAFPIAHSLDLLAQRGSIRLYAKQDSPTKPYFTTRHLRGITIV